MLTRITINHLNHHRLQTFLMILGIALGVAVTVAIDIANTSASRAFDLSIDSIAGRATHQIVGGPNGLEDDLFAKLKRAGLNISIAPIVSAQVTSRQLGNTPLQLLGVDPFSEPPFRDSFVIGSNEDFSSFVQFLIEPNSIAIARTLAERNGLVLGDSIELEVSGKPTPARIVGFLESADNLKRLSMESLVVADISSAQEMTGHLGRLDRIDVVISEGDTASISKITQLLPENAQLLPSDSRSGLLKEMIGAFRLNLTALGLLALVVGLFLIYNTMTFSVIRRRELFGTLRTLGITRWQILVMVILEAAIVGSLGSGIGLILGTALGQGTVRAVTQTISDLYFTLMVSRIPIDVGSLVRGFTLGLAGTILSSIAPAIEANNTPPRAVLRRSSLEMTMNLALRINGIIGVTLAALSIAILSVPTNNLIISFAGTFTAVMSCALITPIALHGFMKAINPLTEVVWGAMGRLAPRNVINTSSRTAVAVAALMVSVSVMIGVSVMVSSFRNTVIIWLAQTLQDDVYITVPGGTAAQPSAPIDSGIVDALTRSSRFMQVDILRAAVIQTEYGQVRVNATNNHSVAEERLLASTLYPPSQVWSKLQLDAVLVSEPFSNLSDDARPGGEIRLSTDQGTRQFQVVAVYYDYSSTQGTVIMSIDTYRRYWNDNEVTAIGLRLPPNADPGEVSHELQDEFNEIQSLSIQPNQDLREEVLAVFDRTFAVTVALEALATLVAFVGILSSFLSLELEKQRETGILRTIGFTPSQVRKLVFLETGLMGTFAGLAATPTGLVLSYILIYIINRRSFGWTLQMSFQPDIFIQALIVSASAALIAGIYPAWRISRTSPTQILSSE